MPRPAKIPLCHINLVSATLLGMPINQRHIDNLKAIYEKEFNQKISDKEAQEMGKRLVDLVRVLMKNDITK